jgi:hypothetical protein
MYKLSSQLLPLLLFSPLLVLLQSPLTNVISTEGGALCRRSGEIPVFRLCRCLFYLTQTKTSSFRPKQLTVSS